jgi:hypothetical protein
MGVNSTDRGEAVSAAGSAMSLASLSSAAGASPTPRINGIEA